ncbi:MAG: TonB-dependent receptor [Proteobacteria bacterium]|nr:TonB-dependent receptor [Pseudomonadota bacterium]
MICKHPILSACGLLLAVAVALPAQSAAPGAATDSNTAATDLSEVVVTATRREERLQDVPISATVFTPESIAAQGIHSIDDLSRVAPSLTFQRTSTGNTGNENDEDSSINIRGIESSAGTATVGVYIDDTPIQGRHLTFTSFSTYPAVFDLERIEVLRGPQGTLFGAGSEGGTVRFIQPAPDLRRSGGFARAELSSTRNGDPSYELGAAVGGPVTDTWALRLSAFARQDGGWVDRADWRTGQITRSASNSQTTVVLRAAAAWKPSDALTITPSLYFQRLQLRDTSAYWQDLSDPGASRYLNGNAQRNQSIDPFYLAAVKLQWSLGVADLTSTVSYFSRQQHSTQDYTQYDRTVFGLTDVGPRPPPGDLGTTFDSDAQRNFYFETRLQSPSAPAGLNWSAGLYFARLDENTTERVTDPRLDAEYAAFYGAPLCTDVAPCPGGQIITQPRFQVIDTQLALFGDVAYAFADHWKLDAGLRVERSHYAGTLINYGPFFGPDIGPTTALTGASSATQTPLTPRMVLSYSPDRDRMAYASIAKGYRVGGINLSLSSLCADDLGSIGLAAAPPTYAPDSLWSYELGAKASWFGGRLHTDASLFSVDWHNIQQAVYLPNCGQGLIENLGTVHSVGGELETQLLAWQGLRLGLSLAYVDARYTHTVCAGSTPCSGPAAAASPVVSEGDRLPAAPWTVHASAEYTGPGASAPYVRLDYQLALAQTRLQPYQNPNNGVSDPSYPGLPNVATLALRAGWRHDGWDLSVFANNLTNAHPVVYRSRDSTDSDLFFVHTIRPRTLGATVSHRF